MSNLIRVRSGPFALGDSWTIDELAELVGEVDGDAGAIWGDVAIHPDIALGDLTALLVDEPGAAELRHGRSLPMSRDGGGVPLDAEFARAYDAEGDLVAICTTSPDGGFWCPMKVFND